jgi:hypothetical protein
MVWISVRSITPNADTHAMPHHLQAVSQTVATGRHAILLLDRAS